VEVSYFQFLDTRKRAKGRLDPYFSEKTGNKIGLISTINIRAFLR
jgi:hypothetical protein